MYKKMYFKVIMSKLCQSLEKMTNDSIMPPKQGQKPYA